MSTAPNREGCSPEASAIRDGAQTGALTVQVGKLTPASANRRKLGVLSAVGAPSTVSR
ncbi:MAG: hypothetical protein OXN27_16880 [Candidatus Poribacteria bacterium]|nr:hypothetical protein [Candidatus Poribacteria bacterium]